MIVPVYRASFVVQRVNVIGSFFRGIFLFLSLCCIQELGQSEKVALKTGCNKITDILNKEPEQTKGNIFKNRLSESKVNQGQKINKMMGSGLVVKRKRKSKKAHSQSKRRKVKDIFTEK